MNTSPLLSWTTWLKYELALISLRARGFFLSKRSIELVKKKTTDDLLVSIEVEIACVGAMGKAKRLPKELEKALSDKLIINEF